MNVRNTRARLCAVLFTSLFTSISFAQVSWVNDRASLDRTDFIDWQAYYDDGTVGTLIKNSADVLTKEGFFGLTVEHLGPDDSVIFPEPGFFGDTNLPNGVFTYHTNYQEIFANPISFSDFTGLDVCALGTQISPIESGSFTARIEAFDATDVSLGFFDITSATSNPDALFMGIENTEPMARVEVSVLVNGGMFPSWYSINQVDLRACDSAPALACEGFGAPMAVFPVKARKNGVFPLKMELFDADGFEITGADLAAAPVVEVLFTASPGGDAVDVSSDVLGVGHATEGNQFVYTEDGIWQFNLQSKGYSSEGTYVVTAVSGDTEEYVFEPACVTSFVK